MSLTFVLTEIRVTGDLAVKIKPLTTGWTKWSNICSRQASNTQPLVSEAAAVPLWHNTSIIKISIISLAITSLTHQSNRLQPIKTRSIARKKEARKNVKNFYFKRQTNSNRTQTIIIRNKYIFLKKIHFFTNSFQLKAWIVNLAMIIFIFNIIFNHLIWVILSYDLFPWDVHLGLFKFHSDLTAQDSILYMLINKKVYHNFYVRAYKVLQCYCSCEP